LAFGIGGKWDTLMKEGKEIVALLPRGGAGGLKIPVG